MKTLSLSNEEIDVLISSLQNAPKFLAVDDMYWPTSGKWAIAYDLLQRLRHLRSMAEAA